MKKALLAIALVLGGLSTYAMFPVIWNPEIEVVPQQEEFKEVTKEELPQAVKDALKVDFQTATLNKAFVNEKQEYKLEITVDGAASTVYADKDGNWIEI